MRFTVIKTRPNAKQDEGVWGIVDARNNDTDANLVVKSSFWPLPCFSCVFPGMIFETEQGHMEYHAQYGEQFITMSPVCMNTHYAATVSALITSFPDRPKWLFRVLRFCKLELYTALADVHSGKSSVTTLGLKNDAREIGFARKLTTAFSESKTVIDLCSEFPTLPVKVAMSLQNVTSAAIKQNPWVLAQNHKVEREAMLPIADQIGITKFGHPPNDPLRLRAYVFAAYKELTEDAAIGDDERGAWNDEQGSTWLCKRVFMRHVSTLLTTFSPDSAATVSTDIQNLFEPVTMPAYLRADVDSDAETLFTIGPIDCMERELAQMLTRRRDSADMKALFAVSSFERLMELQGRDIAIEEQQIDSTLPGSRWREVYQLYRHLDATQRSCIRVLIENRLLLLVGGAGTGKTRTLSCCIRFLVDVLGEETRALALMGKAAVRIQQTLGAAVQRVVCRTIHSETARKLDAMSIPSYAVDEIGTCPPQLLHRLIGHAPMSRYLILCGDDKQLPSIQPGMLLHDILLSNCLPTVRLERIHRSVEGSEIARLSPTIFGPNHDFFVERSGDLTIRLLQGGRAKSNEAEAQLRTAIEAFVQLKADGSHVQMLTNINATAEEANRLLQPIVLPNAPHAPRLERGGGAPFVCGDRVVCTETVDIQVGDETTRIYNGTLGTIREIDVAAKMFVVDFDDGNTHAYKAGTRAIRHAYCLTVHRSQGSEYDCAVVLFTSCFALSKNLLYTAITRAQRRVTLITSQFSLTRALQTEIRRTTRLATRLCEAVVEDDDDEEDGGQDDDERDDDEESRVRKWVRLGGGAR